MKEFIREHCRCPELRCWVNGTTKMLADDTDSSYHSLFRLCVSHRDFSGVLVGVFERNALSLFIRLEFEVLFLFVTFSDHYTGIVPVEIIFQSYCRDRRFEERYLELDRAWDGKTSLDWITRNLCADFLDSRGIDTLFCILGILLVFKFLSGHHQCHSAGIFNTASSAHL